MPPKTPRQSGAGAPAATATAIATPTQPTYSFRDIVLAKVKGHPAWPARIIDPHTAPMNLRDERKIAQKNSYLVKFFKTADYAWMNAKEVSKLEPPEIRAFIDNPNKKGADLKAAYQIALAPESWEAELEEIQRQYDEEQKALELDELEPAENEEEAAIAPSKTKQKRKRASEVKTPTASTKKRKSDVHSTNGSVNASATPEPAPTPVTKKRGRKKDEVIVPVDGEATVREWRHKLQRIFLGKADATEKIMPDIDEVFKDIEAFEMKTEWLTSSKLGKVLKRVGVLDDGKIPLDDKYHIRARSRALQEKWRQTLGIGEESAPNRAQPTEPDSEVKVETNDKAKVDPDSLANGKKTKEVADKNKVEEANTAVIENTAGAAGKANLAESADESDQVQDGDVMPEDDTAVPEAVQENEAAKEEDTQMDVDLPDESTKLADPADEENKPPPADEASLPVVNGDSHSVNENKEAANGSDGAKTDVEMTTAIPEAVSPQKSDVDENEEDGDQMDCGDTPEPTNVELEANQADENEAGKENVD